MVRLNIKKIAHFFTLILVILLLCASKEFLVSNPVISAAVLTVFSILYLVIGVSLDSGFFIYPSIALFIMAYYLTAYHLDPYTYRSPILSIGIVGLFLLLSLSKKISQLILKPIIQSTYALICFFTLYIFYNISHFAIADQKVPAVTFLLYGAAICLLGIRKRRELLRYWAVINISLSFLFLLYAITPIPKEQYSLYLMAFFICMMYVGTLIHRRFNFLEARPLYWTGFLGLSMAPLYSFHHPGILIFIQALLALHFWEIHAEIHTIEPNCDKIRWTCQIFNIMVYPLTLICLFILIQQRFAVSFTPMGSCLIFAFLYFKIAHEHRQGWQKNDIILPVMGIVFITIAYFMGLFLYFSPHNNPWICLASAPLIWGLLAMGCLYSKKSTDKLGVALFRAQYISLAIALVLPLFLQARDILLLLCLAVLLLVTYMFMYLKRRWSGFFYAIPITFSYIYYLFLLESATPNIFYSIAFMIPAVTIVVMALWFQSKNSGWSKIFYFWWYTLSIMALLCLNANHISMGYTLAFWGLLYLLVGAFAKIPQGLQTSRILTTGHTLTVAAGILVILFMNPGATLHVFLLIVAGYLMLYLKKRENNYLYPIGIAGAVIYYLLFLQNASWAMIHMKAIPFLAITYGIWIILSSKNQPERGLPLKKVGHITALFYTIVLLLNMPQAQIGLSLFSIVLYALIYSLIIFFRSGYDILFLSMGFGSLIYFQFLDLIEGMGQEMHLRLFILIMIPLSLLGYLLWRQKKGEWAFPTLDLVVIISLVTTLVSLSMGYVRTTQSILIMSAVLFMGFSLFLKKDLYIYLTTLCLGLSAYNALIAANNRFAIDLVVYAVYTFVFIGIFFFLPVLRRMVDYRGPRYMISAINWKSLFFYGSIISMMTLAFFFLYSLQLANFPGFCSKCHFMKPYAEAWQHSTHKDVNCVDCHYEPGLEPVIKGKINGLVSVVKYLTHTYSIKPNSEITDASCLREGCHNKMDLHKEIGFKKNVFFNHEHHLKSLRRGKQLRCTTCHSQIVQGEHITVTESICFTCHFIGRDNKGIGIGKCVSCHDYPAEKVKYQGIEFDHRSFLEGKPDTLCMDCHAGVTEGEGTVPVERCYSCHMERNPDLTDAEALHAEHITKRKVECFECHMEIKHGAKTMSGQINWDCKACHTSSHSVAEKMYIGIGAIDVSGEPDPMFTAKVSCQGCHKYSKTIQIGSLSFETTKADVIACDDCHGAGSGYSDLALEWQKETKGVLARIMDLRKRLKNPIIKLNDKELSDLFLKTDANLQFVERDGSDGVHNYVYTQAILERIEQDLLRCLSLLEEKGYALGDAGNEVES